MFDKGTLKQLFVEICAVLGFLALVKIFVVFISLDITGFLLLVKIVAWPVVALIAALAFAKKFNKPSATV
jgi:hypothetical protein